MSRSATTVALIAVASLLYPPQAMYASPKSTEASTKTTAPITATASSQATQELSFEEIEYEKGLTFYKAGDYEHAVASFVKVYRVSPNPNLIYNIARCFEELKRFEQAADSYEEYLKLSPEASDRPQIEVTIKTLRSLAKSQTAQPKSKPQDTASVAEPSPVDQKSSTGNKTLSYGLLGAGAAFIAGGVWYGLEASDAASRRDSANSGSQFNLAQSEMSSAALRADLLTIGGAIVATSGLIVLFTSSSDEHEPVQEGVQVSVSPRHVAFSWQF